MKLPFIEDRGTGILAYDSEFEVSKKHPPFDIPVPMNLQSAFEGLYKGIETYSFSKRNINVRETHFENTLQCITTNGNMGDIIQKNDFTFNIPPFFEEGLRPEDTPPPSIYDAWAVYSIGSNDYEINENTIDFIGFSVPAQSGGGGIGDGGGGVEPPFFKPNYYGIIVNNTAGGGMVNENEFNVASNFNSEFVENLTGTQTEENNKSVEMGCNIYHNFESEQEWLINPISPNDNPNFENRLDDQGSGCGSDPQTGDPLPAGNLFQNNCGNSEANIRVGFLDAGFEYWANGLPGSESYPDCSSTNGIGIFECQPDNQLAHEVMCPAGNSGSGGIGKAMVNSNSPTGIAAELNNGNYDETEKTLLTTAVYKIYEEAEQESDAIVFLEAMNTHHSNSILMKKYLNKGLLLEAQNKLNALHGGGVYDASYIQFYQLLIDVQVSGRKYTELTALELQTAENIAQANTYGSVYAESLLAMLNQTTVDRIPHKESMQGNKRALENTEQDFSVYPNPSKDFVVIESNTATAKLLIYDITGLLIEVHDIQQNKQQVPLNLSVGTYILQLHSATGILSKKIVVMD
ncbi:MAG: T9SS type A sorting domain-containing protein [Chitinophagales bacterium]